MFLIHGTTWANLEHSTLSEISKHKMTNMNPLICGIWNGQRNIFATMDAEFLFEEMFWKQILAIVNTTF